MVLPYLIGHDDVVVLNRKRLVWLESMNSMVGMEVPVLRVTGWNCPPYAWGSPAYKDEYDNEFFKITGPLYSLMVEAAKMMNYT